VLYLQKHRRRADLPGNCRRRTVVGEGRRFAVERGRERSERRGQTGRRRGCRRVTVGEPDRDAAPGRRLARLVAFLVRGPAARARGVRCGTAECGREPRKARGTEPRAGAGARNS